MLRAEPAAPAARSSVRGTVNPYWLQQAERRKQNTRHRQQAYKKAQARKGSRPQGHKQQVLKLVPGLKVKGGWARKLTS